MRFQGPLKSLFPASLLLVSSALLGCPPRAAITVSPAAAEIEIGGQVQLQAASTDAQDTFTWSTGDESIADVNQSGLVVGIAEGEVTITVEGAHSGASGEAAVTVLPASEGEGEGEGETGTWPGIANAYSWDGSWEPDAEDLPPDGLYDDVYFDGHEVAGEASPVLPPGAWDWVDEGTSNVTELGAWQAFSSNLGTFEPLEDNAGHPFGWRFLGNAAGGVTWNYEGDRYEGSAGTDVLDLGPAGRISLTSALSLRDGPDMVRYLECSAADWRTGSSAAGHLRDNDLAIAGGDTARPAGEYDVRTSTLHTGPGRDLVFVNNIERAAVDLGNGANGRTDTLDPNDGDDMAVVGGNGYDFRLFGGEGNDTFVWRVDEVNQNTPWLGANFFGGGGWTPAAWDEGTDRIVLVVPVDTAVENGAASAASGVVAVWIDPDYSPDPVSDPPTEDDVYARYYASAGIGPGGKKTVLWAYESVSGNVHTGYCAMTGIEELQVGLGPQARVYRIDETNGVATYDASLPPLVDLPSRATANALMDSFKE